MVIIQSPGKRYNLSSFPSFHHPSTSFLYISCILLASLLHPSSTLHPSICPFCFHPSFILYPSFFFLLPIHLSSFFLNSFHPFILIHPSFILLCRINQTFFHPSSILLLLLPSFLLDPSFIHPSFILSSSLHDVLISLNIYEKI